MNQTLGGLERDAQNTDGIRASTAVKRDKGNKLNTGNEAKIFTHPARDLV